MGVGYYRLRSAEVTAEASWGIKYSLYSFYSGAERINKKAPTHQQKREYTTYGTTSKLHADTRTHIYSFAISFVVVPIRSIIIIIIPFHVINTALFRALDSYILGWL